MNTAQYNEKQQIELATAEGFFALYNAQFQTAYVVTHIAGDRETPDVQAKNETGKKFNLEITLTENRPVDIATLLGRSDKCSIDALKQRLEAVRRGKESMQILSLPENALPVLLKRINNKLVKRYGPNTALVVRDTSNLWDWEQVLPSVRQHLNGKTIPFDLGIWLLTGNKTSLIQIYAPTC